MQTTDTLTTDTLTIDQLKSELKTQIKRLNSKAGQMKMDLHDLAEGLPTDYNRLIEAATETYEVYRLLNDLKTQLKQLEQQL